MSATIIDMDVERENAAIFARLKDLMTQHPEIIERTFSALNEEIKMARNDEQVVIRLPTDLLAEVDALIPIVERMREYTAVGRITRSFVLRLVIQEGVEAMRQLNKPGRAD